MTLRTLYSISLKVVGIFLLEKIIISAAQLVSFVLGYGIGGVVLESLMVLLLPVLYFIFFFLLVFRTDTIIDWLKLVPEKEEVDFSFATQNDLLKNMDAGFIVRLALIGTGIYVLIESVPDFIYQLTVYWRYNSDLFQQSNASAPAIALSAAKILVAYIIIKTNDTIASYAVKTAGSSQSQETND